MLQDFRFRNELVVINSMTATRDQALTDLAKVLFENGFVADSFPKAIIDRENVYPTGLPTIPYSTAIPHTATEHVIKTSIAISVLQKPVEFHVMGMPEDKVEVKVIFMLAIKESHSQVNIIQFIINTLQKGDVLEKIVNSSNIDEITTLLNRNIEEHFAHN